MEWIMADLDDADYRGGETTGFQSPAQDHIEHVIDLSAVLDLGKPGMYPVRVVGQALRERGILDGDILIANAAADPVAGKVVVAFVHGSVLLATLERRSSGWCLLPAGKNVSLPINEDAEVWAIVAGLVRVSV
jgi:SOS-response transcriptional repressor LexA